MQQTLTDIACNQHSLSSSPRFHLLADTLRKKGAKDTNWYNIPSSGDRTHLFILEAASQALSPGEAQGGDETTFNFHGGLVTQA